MLYQLSYPGIQRRGPRAPAPQGPGSVGERPYDEGGAAWQGALRPSAEGTRGVRAAASAGQVSRAISSGSAGGPGTL